MSHALPSILIRLWRDRYGQLAVLLILIGIIELLSNLWTAWPLLAVVQRDLRRQRGMR